MGNLEFTEESPNESTAYRLSRIFIIVLVIVTSIVLIMFYTLPLVRKMEEFEELSESPCVNLFPACTEELANELCEDYGKMYRTRI